METEIGQKALVMKFHALIFEYLGTMILTAAFYYSTVNL